MASDDMSFKQGQCIPKLEANIVTNEETKLDDREWQLNQDLAKSMLSLYKNQLWTDVTFSFEEQVSQVLKNPLENEKGYVDLLIFKTPKETTLPYRLASRLLKDRSVWIIFHIPVVTKVVLMNLFHNKCFGVRCLSTLKHSVPRQTFILKNRQT